MNPARLHALYDAWLGPPRRRESYKPAQQDAVSLSAFMMGGR